LVHWAVTAPAALILGTFAVSNRAGVTVSLWPILGPVDVPVYLIVLTALLVGFLAGEFVAWINGRRARRLARERQRRIDALERELAASQAKAAPPNNPQTALLPARTA
jgi:putative membrane protein